MSGDMIRMICGFCDCEYTGPRREVEPAMVRHRQAHGKKVNRVQEMPNSATKRMRLTTEGETLGGSSALAVGPVASVSVGSALVPVPRPSTSSASGPRVPFFDVTSDLLSIFLQLGQGAVTNRAALPVASVPGIVSSTATTGPITATPGPITTTSGATVVASGEIIGSGPTTSGRLPVRAILNIASPTSPAQSSISGESVVTISDDDDEIVLATNVARFFVAARDVVAYLSQERFLEYFHVQFPEVEAYVLRGIYLGLRSVSGNP